MRGSSETVKTWNFIDKSRWPVRGPWDSEPDKAQWQDEETGLVCLAVRANGSWCGYVGVKEGHPAFQVDYDSIRVGLRHYEDGEETTYPDVHGGLTFSDFCQPGTGEERVCHTPELGQSDRVWWLGFDCAHAGDLRPATTALTHAVNLKFAHPAGYETYRTLEYVLGECRKLAAQLAGVMTVK